MQSAKMILGHFRHRLRHRKLLTDLLETNGCRTFLNKNFDGIQEMGSFEETGRYN